MYILSNYDHSVTAFIRETLPHNTFFDTFFSFLSLYGYSIVFWFVIFLYLIFVRNKRHKSFLLSFMITLGSVSVIVYLLKMGFQRVRPEVVGMIGCPTDFGFPSGHSALAFAAATVLSAHDRRYWWAYYIVASLIALSRIYLGCHYLLDISAGAVVGMLSAIIIMRIYNPHFKTKVP